MALLVEGIAGAALALAVLALGAATAWRRALLRGRGAVRVLELPGDESAATAGRRYVSRLFVTLPLGRRTLLVTADMLEPREFRRLRIWALWGRVPGVAGKQLAA